MNEPWEQDAGIDSDDFVEGIDDEMDELGVDYHTEDVPARAPTKPMPRPLPRAVRVKSAGKKKFRIRAMSPEMVARSPGVVSVLLTRADGSQVLLVRKD